MSKICFKHQKIINKYQTISNIQNTKFLKQHFNDSNLNIGILNFMFCDLFEI